jgi:hypothetical protein
MKKEYIGKKYHFIYLTLFHLTIFILAYIKTLSPYMNITEVKKKHLQSSEGVTFGQKRCEQTRQYQQRLHII